MGIQKHLNLGAFPPKTMVPSTGKAIFIFSLFSTWSNRE